MIYHITTQTRWDELSLQEDFAPEAYEIEKFIHCCEARQIQSVLERYFKDTVNILVLCLDPNKLKSPLRYEPATNNELFPHVYGPINKDAIVGMQKME